MSTKAQCRAVTRAGVQCTKPATTAGFCSLHFPKPKKVPLIERAKTAGQVVTTAAGVITLLQKAVELWQSINFGPGPAMSDSYEYLAEELGSAWGASTASTYRPGNYSATSVDWSFAADLYQYANRCLEKEPTIPEHQEQTEAVMSALTEQFLDGLSWEFQQSLYASLGDVDGDA